MSFHCVLFTGLCSLFMFRETPLSTVIFLVLNFFSKAKPAARSFDSLKYSNCWQDMAAEVIWLGACPDL